MKETRKVKPWRGSAHEATLEINIDLSGFMLRGTDAADWLARKAFNALTIDIQSNIRPGNVEFGIQATDTKTRVADTPSEKLAKMEQWDREHGAEWLTENDGRSLSFTVDELYAASNTPKATSGAKAELSAIDRILADANMTDLERVAAIMALRTK